MPRVSVACPIFYFAAMSPYSWLAAERIDDLIADARWQPLFAGGLFAANARRSWGLEAQRDEKIADCERRAREYGLGPMRWPDPWPVSDILVARAMTYAGQRSALKAFALTAMRLAFLEGANLAELGVLESAARRTGLDPTTLSLAVAQPAIKAEVHAAHERAMSHGVFGVPTVVVGEQLFWGEDQLLNAAAARRTEIR